MGDALVYLVCIAIILGSAAIFAFVFFLREDLKAWMQRTRGLGPRGLELGPPDQQQVRAEAAERGQQAQLMPPPATPDPGLAHWQEQVRAAVASSGLAGPQLINQLEYTLSLAARMIDFHIAARWIFGTQIAALRQLSVAPRGCSLDDLRPLFEEHVRRMAQMNPFATPDILRWVGYLSSQLLVTSEDGRYQISAAGRDFLQFAGTNGFDESKPL
jgi:hypothetical protein